MGHDQGTPELKQSEHQWLKVLGLVGEAPARLMAAQRALELGRGGVSYVAELTGMSRTTVARGIADLQDPKALRRIEGGRSRRTGGGRRPLEVVNPDLRRALAILLEETTAGDPMCALRWTIKSTRTLAEELHQQGHQISHATVGRLVGELGYSLQANVRSFEGEQHVGRDEQFELIHSTVKSFIESGDPVLSVDTKKRELIGPFKNAGQSYRKRGEAERVNAYDYSSQADGIAHPYAAYDVATNQAVVNVGMSADTSEFAVESIRRWWKVLGRPTYPRAARLLICADGGGSNSSSRRTWKFYLQELSNELGVPITVRHYPPGTSKWNKVEHRLFSFISLNWRGKPLTDYETVIQLIGNTKTRTGLQVKALLDTSEYETGQKVTDEQMEALKLTFHEKYPKWNYTISPSSRTRRKA